MRIIYTCPKCGSDLEEMTLTTYPAQHMVYCPNCMWSHAERAVRIPYDRVLRIPYTDKDDSGVCHCTL